MITRVFISERERSWGQRESGRSDNGRGWSDVLAAFRRKGACKLRDMGNL